LQRQPATSNNVTGAAALSPDMSRCHVVAKLPPKGVTAPIPVTTTRLFAVEVMPQAS
jgi:hypothetical protein